MKKQIDIFWNWFSDNQKRFWNYNGDNVHNYLNEIKEKIDSISNIAEFGVALEFFEVSDTKKRIEISADGVEKMFSTISQIVESAPKFENWDIVAFRQPIETPFTLEFEDMRFETSKMLFLPFEDENDELNLVIFGDNFKDYDENALLLYGLTTIDNLIGEYNCVMKVKGYDFQDKSEIGDDTVYTLEDLSDFLEHYYCEKK